MARFGRLTDDDGVDPSLPRPAVEARGFGAERDGVFLVPAAERPLEAAEEVLLRAGRVAAERLRETDREGVRRAGVLDAVRLGRPLFAVVTERPDLFFDAAAVRRPADVFDLVVGAMERDFCVRWIGEVVNVLRRNSVSNKEGKQKSFLQTEIEAPKPLPWIRDSVNYVISIYAL